MTTLEFWQFAVGCLALVAVALLFMPGKRRAGVLLIFIVGYAGAWLDSSAKQSGFHSTEEMIVAQRNGIHDPKDWKEKRFVLAPYDPDADYLYSEDWSVCQRAAGMVEGILTSSAVTDYLFYIGPKERAKKAVAGCENILRLEELRETKTLTYRNLREIHEQIGRNAYFGRQWRRAAKAFARGAELLSDEKSLELRLWEGAAYLVAGDFDEAEATFRRALEEGSAISLAVWQAHAGIGRALVGLGKKEEALEVLEHAVSIRKQSCCNVAAWRLRPEQVYASIGKLYAIQGEHQPAIDWYSRAIGVSTSKWEASYRTARGRQYELSGQTLKAIEDYRKALKIDDDQDFAKTSLRGLGITP